MDRELRDLCLLDHLDDPRQHGIRADSSDLHTDRTVGIHCPADHLITQGFEHRHRFPREHRFIQVRTTIDDNAIDGHTLPWADAKNIPRDQPFDRCLNLFLIFQNTGHRWPQFDERFDRGTRSPLCPRFEIATEQDQSDDHHRGLEINGLCLERYEGWRESDDRRIDPSSARTHRNKAVHIRRAFEQSWNAEAIEPLTWPDHEQGRQEELDAAEHRLSNHHIDPVMDLWEQMPAHLQNKNWQCQEQSRRELRPYRRRLFGFAFRNGLASAR